MDHLPESGGASSLLDNSWQGGGMIATGLVAASVLGASCGMVGVVGGDRNGIFCRKDLEKNGVDTSRLLVDTGGTTTMSFVLTEKEKRERSFVHNRGNHRHLKANELDEAYIGAAKYLLVTSMDEASVAACRIARQHGTKVVIDASIFNELTMKHIDLIDVLVASENFYHGLYKDENYVANCREIGKMGPEVAIVTLGSRGCAGFYRGKPVELPAFKVDVTDTCGAGDVYHGAFIYAMMQGWEGDHVARFASAVSAIKCTRLGGRAGIPSGAVAQRFIDTGAIDYTEIDKRVEMYRNRLE